MKTGLLQSDGSQERGVKMCLGAHSPLLSNEDKTRMHAAPQSAWMQAITTTNW